ncbi:MBL fold metallo-hydrolase [Sulfitobacter sp. F26204]|uniref:MBL fold metallo-hydrolase n=1 Tax=Sulfitobacter sp. F26204 TaxID=2996014 RepID=UPI00225DF446|nr:MBL fold metallo-hydrolase [Sulfitobacter sp. F26204]MCX7561732.1 MBL fold metallo-hydrolase [Sulfitobacter sp. F26204]
MTANNLPHMQQVQIDEMRISALLDFVGPARTAAELFLDPPSAIFENEQSWLVPNYAEADTGRLVLSYQSFLIELAGKVILIDCAVGEDGNFPSRPDWHRKKSNWLNHLGQAGYALEDVDTVFLSHLHMDHIGWLTRLDGDAWRPTFPNARHVTTKAEYDYWSARHGEMPYMSTSFNDCVAPVERAGLLEFVAPGEELAHNLFVTDLAGHSPGMAGLEWCRGKRVIAAFCADLMHHPLQVTHPELSTVFCFDGDAAATARKKKLSLYADHGTEVFCGHFPGDPSGKIVRDGQRQHFRPTRWAAPAP